MSYIPVAPLPLHNYVPFSIRSRTYPRRSMIMQFASFKPLKARYIYYKYGCHVFSQNLVEPVAYHV